MRRLLIILSIIILTAFQAQGQSSRIPVMDAADKIIKLYPNPANSYIVIDLQKDIKKGFTFQVYNVLGKKMYESQKLAEKITLDLIEFNRGVYIYHLINQSGKVIEYGKFQVSH